ncbi:hypothetical protein IAT38_002056 [Cryptococcus sp. DSM 104549]
MSDLKAVRKYAAQHDLFNRLHSIAADEAFVHAVAHDWYADRFEVVANQRCGTWYCEPSTSSKVYAYFKSTDGHMSHWDFNLRRSNLSLASYAEEHGGFILVDSTRKGKRMPDGLSKTVPIWCTVINMAMAMRHPAREWDTNLYLPPQIVPATERSQIESRLKGWAEALEGDEIPSVTTVGERRVGFEYVPGGGDDDELWARGLSPTVFHAHKRKLLATERQDLPSFVDGLIESTASSLDPHLSSSLSGMTLTSSIGIPTPSSLLALSLGPPSADPPTPWAYAQSPFTVLVVEVDKYPKSTPYAIQSETRLVFAVPSAKSDGKAYAGALGELVEWVRQKVGQGEGVILKPGSMADLVTALRARLDEDELASSTLDPTIPPPAPADARKLIIPLAVVLLCSIPRTSLQPSAEAAAPPPPITKAAIAEKLHSLISIWPDGNPPRAALKRVNEILMSDGRRR